jgi:regulator of sigma E protease
MGVILGFTRRPVGLGEAVVVGAVTSAGTVVQAVEIFRAMIRGRVSAESASGPVGIMAMSAETVQKGWGELLQFCGMISVSLAVVNLFPIPPFDGFHIVLLGYESLIRRRIEAKRQVAFMIGGFVFVVALFVLLTYKDIFNWIRYGTP